MAGIFKISGMGRVSREVRSDAPSDAPSDGHQLSKANQGKVTADEVALLTVKTLQQVGAVGREIGAAIYGDYQHQPEDVKQKFDILELVVKREGMEGDAAKRTMLKYGQEIARQMSVAVPFCGFASRFVGNVEAWMKANEEEVTLLKFLNAVVFGVNTEAKSAIIGHINPIAAVESRRSVERMGKRFGKDVYAFGIARVGWDDWKKLGGLLE